MKQSLGSQLRLASTVHDYVDSVPWGVLFDAYGRATPLKKFLLDLHTGSPDEKDEAIYDGLWGHAIHQHTWYTATLFTIPPVVMALRDGIWHQTPDLLEFLCSSVRIGTWHLRWRFGILPVSVIRVFQLPFLVRVGLPSLEREIPKARTAFTELADNTDARIRERARRLLDFCDNTGRRT